MHSTIRNLIASAALALSVTSPALAWFEPVATSDDGTKWSVSPPTFNPMPQGYRIVVGETIAIRGGKEVTKQHWVMVTKQACAQGRGLLYQRGRGSWDSEVRVNTHKPGTVADKIAEAVCRQALEIEIIETESEE